MPRRPILGRAGAGMLIGVAALLANLAIPKGSFDPALTHPVASLSLSVPAPARSVPNSSSPAASPLMQEVEVVPLGRPVLRVPILMYHYIRVNPNPRDSLGFALSVTPDDFRRQMDLLAERRYSPIGFEELRAYWSGQQPLPSRPVILTFDDGYADFYTTAYPILRQHGFKAVAYVVPGFLNGPNYMSTAQVQDLDVHGIEIGSHTVSHPDLTRVSASQLSYQLTESKRVLEQMVGHPVLDFCYPSGMFNPAVAAAVQAAGYQSATTTQPGVAHSVSDRFAWSRQRVAGGMSVERFAADLGVEESTSTIVRPVALGGSSGRPLTYPLIAPLLPLPDRRLFEPLVP